jgi:hypothetical protein
MKNEFTVHFVETKKNDKLLSLGRAENIPWPSQLRIENVQRNDAPKFSRKSIM